jgi:hypothetical protein
VPAEGIADALDGKTVWIEGRAVPLSARQLHIDADLVWERCDQSRSMFIPFFVVRQPRGDGQGHEDKIYVRASDGVPFPALTHML